MLESVGVKRFVAIMTGLAGPIPMIIQAKFLQEKILCNIFLRLWYQDVWCIYMSGNSA